MVKIMMNHEQRKCIKRGHWQYADVEPCIVEISRSNILYGSGDFEDLPHIQEDQTTDHFEILYFGSDGKLRSSGGIYFTLDECIAAIKKQVPQSVTWEIDLGCAKEI